MSERDLSRREFLGAIAATLGSAVPAALQARATESPAAPPATHESGRRQLNLILYFTDEMRADALACYGNPVTHTPHFDLLARQGSLFMNCHVQNPVCAQSRCSMLTGWPTSVRGHRSLYYLLHRDEPNMFRYLRQAGYDVFWFGKNDALAPDAFPESVTEWKDGLPSKAARRTGAAKAPTTGTPNTMLMPGGMDRRMTIDYPLVQDAIRILERRETDRPFCIFLPLIQPHPPYMAPEGFVDLYDPAKLPPLAPPNLPKKPPHHDAIRKAFNLTQVDDGVFRKIRATYYGQVSYSDWLLGELLDAVERTGHTEDTALFVSSDHGDYAGDYGLIEKWPSGLESCLTHVPLIARVPGGKAGATSPEMVELYDLMATFLELGGTRATHTNFARSLLPQIHGGSGDAERAAFSEGGYNVYEPQAFEPRQDDGLYAAKSNLENDRPDIVERAASVKTQRYTYIARPGATSELYDREKDPLETRNLIDSKPHSAIRDQLQQRLLNWYVNTSGVPAEFRDERDMPPYIRNEISPDQANKIRSILDR